MIFSPEELLIAFSRGSTDSKRGKKRSCQPDLGPVVVQRLKRYYDESEEVHSFQPIMFNPAESVGPKRCRVVISHKRTGKKKWAATPKKRAPRVQTVCISAATLEAMVKSLSAFRCPLFLPDGGVCDLPSGTSGFCTHHSTSISRCKKIINYIYDHIEIPPEEPLCSADDVKLIQRTVADIYKRLTHEQDREILTSFTEVRLTCDELVKEEVATRRWIDAEKCRHSIYIYGDRVVAQTIKSIKEHTCYAITRRRGRCNMPCNDGRVVCAYHKPYFLHEFKLLLAVLKRIQ